jgi:hypothetical protein
MATAFGLIAVVVGVVGLGLHRLSATQYASDSAWQPPAKATPATDPAPAIAASDAQQPPDPRPLSIMLWAGDAVPHGHVHLVDRKKDDKNNRSLDPANFGNPRRARHEMMAGHPITNYLAGWQDSDDAAEWTLDLPKAGDYEIDLTYSCPQGTPAGEFILKIADKELAYSPQPTRGPQGFRMATAGKLPLPAGKSTLTLHASPRSSSDRPWVSLRSVQIIPTAAP